MAKDSTQIARKRFAEIVARPDEEIDLAEAALLIAVEEYPRLDVALYIDKLDRFADIARDRADGAADTMEMISALNEALFEDLGFRGNTENYYDPRNSFLNEVIDRRTGIPITITLVYIEVARRISLPIHGVGLPFHFIAKFMGDEEIFIDPFNGGRVLGHIECSELVSNMSSGQMRLEASHLEAITRKQLLVRMLSNLLGIYTGSNDYGRAIATIERILQIVPESLIHIRDRGLLLAAAGENARAAAELERYLAMEPPPDDAEMIRKQIAIVRQAQARLN